MTTFEENDGVIDVQPSGIEVLDINKFSPLGRRLQKMPIITDAKSAHLLDEQTLVVGYNPEVFLKFTIRIMKKSNVRGNFRHYVFPDPR